ncbi:MAG: BMC domain-containing protein [Eubacteriales bacterium]|nr:BMC domain-containing protein [Eubacteriales bacterium]
MDNNIKLRTYIIIDNMQPQYAAVTGTVVKGDVCMAGMSQLYIELEPGSGVYKLMDIALKQTNAKPGFQIVEREYGEIEFHSKSIDDVTQAGQAILESCGLSINDRMKPKVVSEQIISNVDPYQAQLINRDNRFGSVLIPGESLFILEVEPAAYISIAVNEAEKNSKIKLITFDPVGRFGRMYVSGTVSEVNSAREAAISALERITGQ